MKNGVNNIQAAAWNGARMVVGLCSIFAIHFNHWFRLKYYCTKSSMHRISSITLKNAIPINACEFKQEFSVATLHHTETQAWFVILYDRIQRSCE